MSPLITDATALYSGSTPVTAVYAGTVKVWPPTPADLWLDSFDRVAANIAALGNGWSASGTSALASANGADLAYLSNGAYGRLTSATTVTLPANYGIEVIAPRASWSTAYHGLIARYTGGASPRGVKVFTTNGTSYVIGDASGFATDNQALTITSGLPAGWTGAGDHTMRLEVVNDRADLYCDGQHVGYRSNLPSYANSGVTGTAVGFCGDTGATARTYRSMRVYPLNPVVTPSDGGWTNYVNDPLTSLSGLSTGGGTWTVNTYVQVTGSVNWLRARSTTICPPGHTRYLVEVQAEMGATMPADCSYTVAYRESASQSGRLAGGVINAGGGNFRTVQDEVAWRQSTAWVMPPAGRWITLRLEWTPGTNAWNLFADGGIRVSDTFTQTFFTNIAPSISLVSPTTATVRFRNLRAWWKDTVDAVYPTWP